MTSSLEQIQGRLVVESFDDVPSGAPRLRIGAEFCEALLPTVEELDSACGIAVEASLPMTLVTPPCSGLGVDTIRRLTARLPEGSEVVVNDLGAMQVCRQIGGLSLTAGRVFSKNKRDPRFASVWEALPVEVAANYRKPTILDRDEQDWLLDLGVRRVEIDVPPWELDWPPDVSLGVSVHLGQYYVTTSRRCPTLFAAGVGFFPLATGCERPCQRFRVNLRNAAIAQGMTLIGNTYYATSGEPLGLPTYVDRAVFAAELFALGGDLHDPTS